MGKYKVFMTGLLVFLLLIAVFIPGCGHGKHRPVNPPVAPGADFDASPKSGVEAPLTVQFTDTSTGDITCWSWDFDNDGSEDSTDQNPSYAYNSTGRYTVKLTVTGPAGTDDETRIDYIRVCSSKIYVRTGGSDANDGSTWALAVQTIQRGINLAVDDKAVVVAKGKYMGAGNVNLDFVGKAIHLKGVTAGGGYDVGTDWVIDGGNVSRGLVFQTNEMPFSVVDGFTIQNCYTVSDGGGIACYYSAPTIANCTIMGNAAQVAGGGIASVNSSPTIINCALTNNQTFYGGGIAFSGSGPTVLPTVTNCTITGNTAMGPGGGIFCSDSSPEISNCEITGNVGYTIGGGIACTGASTQPKIVNCLIANNSTLYASPNGGGGVGVWFSGPVSMTNCTIADNLASNGGGILLFSSSLTLNNTILWGNFSNNSAGHQTYTMDAAAAVTLNTCDYANGVSDVAGSGTVTASFCINSDPRFLNPVGGDYHLQVSSPCIDRGKNYLLPASETTDLDGNPRIRNGRVDLGAYEYQP